MRQLGGQANGIGGHRTMGLGGGARQRQSRSEREEGVIHGGEARALAGRAGSRHRKAGRVSGRENARPPCAKEPRPEASAREQMKSAGGEMRQHFCFFFFLLLEEVFKKNQILFAPCVSRHQETQRPLPLVRPRERGASRRALCHMVLHPRKHRVHDRSGLPSRPGRLQDLALPHCGGLPWKRAHGRKLWH